MNPYSYQYKLITSSREVWFQFCETLCKDDYTRATNFNGKSICQLQVHIANTYLRWLTVVHKRIPAPYFCDLDYEDAASVRLLFDKINHDVNEFIFSNEKSWHKPEAFTANETIVSLTPAQLFTHVITHEFHHKGQMLMMARSMGYAPPDTDIIRLVDSFKKPVIINPFHP